MSTRPTATQQIADQLQAAPRAIWNAQATANEAARQLEGARIIATQHEARLTIAAYAAPIFDDGKGGLRAAKNEEERKIAVLKATSEDAKMQRLTRKIAKLRATYECARMELDYAVNVQGDYREIARLWVAELNASATG